MYKIAILGSENSHARRFSKIIHEGHPLLGGVPYSDFQVIGICGDSDDENEYLQKTYGIAEVSRDPAHWVGKADAVMVTARHGGKHLQYAREYIEAGVPAFIDKPITIDPLEAIELIRLAKKHSVPLCGGSSYAFVDDVQYMKQIANSGKPGNLLGGSISAPIDMKNNWGEFFFYSQHLVQIMMEIFGYDVESVIARERGDTVTFLARYQDFDVTGHYGANCSATIYGKSGIWHRNIDFGTDAYLSSFHRFEHMVRTGKMPGTYEDLIKPVFVLNALHQSLSTGQEVPVQSYAMESL